jgi:hypothetical protein
MKIDNLQDYDMKNLLRYLNSNFEHEILKFELKTFRPIPIYI